MISFVLKFKHSPLLLFLPLPRLLHAASRVETNERRAVHSSLPSFGRNLNDVRTILSIFDTPFHVTHQYFCLLLSYTIPFPMRTSFAYCPLARSLRCTPQINFGRMHLRLTAGMSHKVPVRICRNAPRDSRNLCPLFSVNAILATCACAVQFFPLAAPRNKGGRVASSSSSSRAMGSAESRQQDRTQRREEERRLSEHKSSSERAPLFSCALNYKVASVCLSTRPPLQTLLLRPTTCE